MIWLGILHWVQHGFQIWLCPRQILLSFQDPSCKHINRSLSQSGPQNYRMPDAQKGLEVLQGDWLDSPPTQPCRVLHNLLLEDLSSFIPHGSLVFLQSNQPSCPMLFVFWCLHNASSFAWKAPSWSSTNLCLINPGTFFRSLLKCNFLQEKFSHPQEQIMSLVFSLSSHHAFHLWYSYCLPETRHYSKCLLYILTHLIPPKPNAISTIVFA